MTKVLEIKDLIIKFKNKNRSVTAVDGVSLNIKKGEILGVVGESGAGKSLSGMAVMGLLEPPGYIAGGQIMFKDQRIDNLRPKKMRRLRGKSIGMIFQDPQTSLNPLFTVGQQIIETIQTHSSLSTSKARKKALKILDEVGIPAAEKRINSYPHEFSGGLRQRTVIALALACEPDLIIADEPTTALDVSVQRQIMDLLKEICKQRNAAVMLITHDMGVVAEMCDNVAVIYAGRIIEMGKTTQVLETPNHPYTKGLILSIPSISEDFDTLYQIEGAMPRPRFKPIQGCAFYPRCPIAKQKCVDNRPPFIQKKTHKVACWFA